jgi:hypothetical protein
MSVSLYMDEHVHSQITVALRLRGVDVLTVQEDGLAGVADAALLDRATELERVLFSQDTDFLVEAQWRQSLGISFGGIIFARQSRGAIGQYIRDLEVVANIGDQEDFANQVEFLPL